MRATSFPTQHSCLRLAPADFHPATSIRPKQRVFPITCLLPARDVAIDFGKYRGCKLGTLPSRYLQWLIRESHRPSLVAWGDYAQQVLQDPHYKDRLEWLSIEKLIGRSEMRKGGPPAPTAGAKDSMAALGWDLSDSRAWSKVNFSLLGTTEGGRIPRKELPAVPSVSSIRSAALKPASRSPDSAAGAVTGQSTTRCLTLQEEVLRRRQLRRERSTHKLMNKRPPARDDVQTLFPGRESLMNIARQRVDREV